ncbi:hypothetical protein Tco_1444907 [Tanacetum coccineum]
MVEPEVPLKKKDQVSLDEEMARNLEAQLQAELIEEERLARKKEEEANIALIESGELWRSRSSKIFKIFHLLKNSSFAFKSFCFILLFTLSHQIKNLNNLPPFDDDKTNKVMYELHHKAKASPKVEM